ncbi:MAG TPA: 2'-5' RNA ligase [Oscillospiraceae bacterium]|nr:2'-5' RNA ligase [Oscillospiraceae bacterium]HPS35702.1 2'-5' RNA ligase [Oscillospiraceae bacterium]
MIITQNKKLTGIYDKLVQSGFIGEQTKDIPYHFTFGSFDLGLETQVLERTQVVCQLTKPFDIALNYNGLFGLKVLFLAPSINMELLKLYSDLVPSGTVNGSHNWVAHATILMDNPDHIQAAIPIVSQAFSPFVAKIESIGVYEFFPKKFIAEYNITRNTKISRNGR